MIFYASSKFLYGHKTESFIIYYNRQFNNSLFLNYNCKIRQSQQSFYCIFSTQRFVEFLGRECEYAKIPNNKKPVLNIAFFFGDKKEGAEPSALLKAFVSAPSKGLMDRRDLARKIKILFVRPNAPAAI